MRTLAEIKIDFDSAKGNQELVELMNELERDYKTLCYKPSEEFLNKPEVRLYRIISGSRVF